MNIGVRIKFWLLRQYWWILSIVVLSAITFATYLELPMTVVIPVVGSLLSLFYFVQKQKLEELRVFRDIFKDCNVRYDALIERLASVEANQARELSIAERRTLVEYFNLCGEEYLYYSHGFLDPAVWKAWHNGMRAILSTQRINAFWQQEKASDSYYGLPL